MLESLLKGHGMEVTSAENGKDALDKARLNPPDLVISDILMPVMDGYTLCREWKSDEQLKHIPFVFYTATYTELKDEDFGLSLGAEKFILKPQEPDIFMNVIKEVLEKNYAVKQAGTKPLGDEMEFFRQHNEILFKKLEKKIVDLEIANRDLKRLEERYRIIFENATDVIYMIDTDLKVLSVSPVVERILGYKPQYFIGRPVTDLANILMPESFEQAVADTVLILKGETISATIYRFIAKDGTIKYGEVSGSPVMRDGKIIGMISVARDITRRKLAEEALRESEEKYRELVKYAPAGIYEVNYETGRFISVNDVMCEYTGYTKDELLNTNVYNLMTDESQKLMVERFEKLSAGEKMPQAVEYCIRTKGGEKLWTLLNARYIYEE
jgi:PAS domain S-box-containing protein